MRVAFVVFVSLLAVPAAGAWTWPVAGPVLAPFAFDHAHPYAGGQHRGIDIGGAAGGSVVAPAAGTVTFAGSVPSSGDTVTILTGDALSVTLTHLGSVAVAKGASIGEGEAVGTVGPSGSPEQAVPYVHLGVRTAADDNGYLDPLAFLPVAAAPRAAAPAPAPPPEPAPALPPPAGAPAAAPPPAAAPVVAAAAAPSPPAAEAPPAATVEEPSVAPEPEPTPVLLTVGAAAAPPSHPHVVPATEPAELHVHVGHRLVRRAVVVGTPTRRPAPAPRAQAQVVLRRTLPVGAPVRAPHDHHLLLALLVLCALAAAIVHGAVRMISSPSSRSEGARPVPEDPRRTGVAVWQRPTPHRPRGGLRRAGRRLRPLSPVEGRRRPDGQRHRRARDAGDGGGRSERGVAA